MTNWLREAIKEESSDVGGRKISMVEVELVSSRYHERNNPAWMLRYDFEAKMNDGRERGGYSVEYCESALMAVRRYFTECKIPLVGGEDVALSLPEELLVVDRRLSEVQIRGYVFGLGLVKACLELKKQGVKGRLEELSRVADTLAKYL